LAKSSDIKLFDGSTHDGKHQLTTFHIDGNDMNDKWAAYNKRRVEEFDQELRNCHFEKQSYSHEVVANKPITTNRAGYIVSTKNS
jgi:hypothetical protein